MGKCRILSSVNSIAPNYAEQLPNYKITRQFLSQVMKEGLIKTMDPVELTDILWSLFIGVVQLEESKMRTICKDHLKDTLKSAFGLICDGL